MNDDMKHSALPEALVEALPYIQKFSGKIVVVKYGGAAMIEDALKLSFAQDIALLERLGMRVIIVHGGGKEISGLAEKLQLDTKFVSGRRVTDEPMLDVVKMVLGGKVNKDIVSHLNRQQVKAIGMSGQDGNLLKCRKHLPQDGGDIGWVGEVVNVDTSVLTCFMQQGMIPVIAPIGYDDEGHTYNINADSAAGSIASAFQAEKLIYLSDVPGILSGGEVVSTLTQERAEAMIAAGEIDGGMIPKVHSAFETLRQGVKKVHMLDGRKLHSLLIEIYTDSGIGTQCVLETRGEK